MSGGIRLKIMPRLPARVIGVTPLHADLTGDQLTLTLDISALAPVAGPVGPTLLSLLNDPADGTWKIAPVANFFSVAGSVPAPTNVQVRNVLLSTAPGVWGWNPVLRGDIGDAGGFGKSLLGTETQADAQGALGFAALLATKAPLSHTHTTGDIVGLGAMALKAKVDISDHANFSGGQKLVGSGSAGAAPAEIALGANLAISGTTLAVTGVAQAGAFGQAVAAATFAGASGTIAKSSGVTSVVKNATGRFTATIPAQPDTDYIVMGGSANSTVGRQTFSVFNKTTTTFQILTDNGASDTDFLQTWFMVFRPQ